MAARNKADDDCSAGLMCSPVLDHAAACLLKHRLSRLDVGGGAAKHYRQQPPLLVLHAFESPVVCQRATENAIVGSHFETLGG